MKRILLLAAVIIVSLSMISSCSDNSSSSSKKGKQEETVFNSEFQYDGNASIDDDSYRIYDDELKRQE